MVSFASVELSGKMNDTRDKPYLILELASNKFWDLVFIKIKCVFDFFLICKNTKNKLIPCISNVVLLYPVLHLN